MPMHSSARKVMAAISVTESEEVLLARIASGPGKFIEDRENLQFHFHFFRDRLDQQIRFAAHVFHGTRSREIRPSAFPSVLPLPFRARSIFQSLPDIGEALLDHLRRDVLQDSAISASCRGISNSASHGARTDHCQSFLRP